LNGNAISVRIKDNNGKKDQFFKFSEITFHMLPISKPV
jgi:hypothetical protein